MNKDKIIKIVEKIESLLSELKSEIDSGQKNAKKIRVDASVKFNKKRKTGPAVSIQNLVSSGFFNSPKTLTELLGEFRKLALNFDKRTVSTELARSVRKQMLIREGAGGSKNPWKYEKK
ncbi:MAG: hypothetical protein UU21_C0002G0005 [Candidatus Levybacteria bacterium GW2011_GWA2_40_8]|nr:MAG: hypothetical protein UU21_C0002G0005 [Candidatus Levybacteria bacterium GW2011_GWA2_40_8]